MMSSQSFSACARTKAPTNAMLALHGDEKASIVVDINHVSVDDKEVGHASLALLLTRPRCGATCGGDAVVPVAGGHHRWALLVGRLVS